MPKKSDVPSRIVRSAIALFSRQGYHRTSTRDIARLADVSEVTLYRYFERKEDVFWSALAACFDTIKNRFDAFDPSGRNSAPEAVLPRILSALIDTAMFSPELVRMVAIALLEVRGKAEEVCRGHMTPLFTAVQNYLQTNIDSGNIRNLDSTIMTFGIALTVFAQPELSKLVEGCRLCKLDSRELVETYTQFWLSALKPAATKGSREGFIPAQELTA
jgi:AcrR family transcriptional regulator